MRRRRWERNFLWWRHRFDFGGRFLASFRFDFFHDHATSDEAVDTLAAFPPAANADAGGGVEQIYSDESGFSAASDRFEERLDQVRFADAESGHPAVQVGLLGGSDRENRRFHATLLSYFLRLLLL